MSNAESHGPTEIPREAIEAAHASLIDGGPLITTAGVERALEAALPPIRERVRRELAKALKERHVRGADWNARECAEFVERFGASRG